MCQTNQTDGLNFNARRDVILFKKGINMFLWTKKDGAVLASGPVNEMSLDNGTLSTFIGCIYNNNTM
jgi:hypothetical protein